MNQHTGNLIIRIVLGVTFFMHGSKQNSNQELTILQGGLQALVYQEDLHTV